MTRCIDIRGLTLPELAAVVPGSKVMVDRGGHPPNTRSGRSGKGYLDFHEDADWIAHGDLGREPTWVPASWVTNASAPEVEIIAIGRGRPVRTKPAASGRRPRPATCSSAESNRDKRGMGMRKLAITTLILSALLPAGNVTGQSLRLGAAELDRVCPVAYGETYLVQPGPSVAFMLPYCPPTKPLVVRRARRLTISLGYPGALKMGAAWFSSGERRTLFAQPIGGPPTQTWYIWLPMQSGSLLVHQWGLPTPSVVSGDIVQPRTDWKVTIRRQAGVVTASPPA